MTPQWLATVVMGANLVLSLIAMAIAYYGRRAREVEELRARVRSIESELAAKPGHDALHEIHLSLVRLAGGMDVIRAESKAQSEVLQRLEKIVGRHDDHLLERRS